MGRGTRWLVGILALTLWVAAPYGQGQQRQTKRNAQRGKHTSQRTTPGRRSHRGAPQVSNTGVNSSGATGNATSVPEGGSPTIENPRPTGTLRTLPNQTLTPGATSVPGNAGGIAPASNDASSGADTPSQGKTAPTTPGANPSNTQGVPTFSSAAQPPDANMPRTVAPGQGTTQPGQQSEKPH